MGAMLPRLIRHLEYHLDPIQRGWQTDPEGTLTPFQVVEFVDCPEPDIHICTTLGISRHRLHSANTSQILHCELMMMSRERTGPLPGLLQQVGKEILATHHAPLRGEVIGLRDPLAEGSAMTALYASLLVCLPDSFAACELEGGEKAIMIWLVPISSAEADYVWTKGWNEFETRLEQQSPDLIDLFRPEIDLR